LQKHWDKTKYATNQDILELLVEHQPKLRFKPDALFDYSNTGYVILSSIIEIVSKQSYGEYLKIIAFDPLEMNNTLVYHRRFMGDTLKNYAIGNIYSRSQGKYILPDSSKNHNYVCYMDCITGDDGISSTILDLKKWNEGLKYNLLVSEEIMNKATAKHELNNGNKSDYGFGIILKKGENIHNIEYHTGGWPGYSTMIVRFTEINKEIIVLTNNGYGSFDSLVDEISVILTSSYVIK
jgi:CubicO group peptidase (beta-lactamase class C family)